MSTENLLFRKIISQTIIEIYCYAGYKLYIAADSKNSSRKIRFTTKNKAYFLEKLSREGMQIKWSELP